MPKNMKERSYNIEEEKAEHEMKEKEKCLENGEQPEENGPNGKEKASTMQELRERAKKLTSKKSLVVIALLCVLLLVFFIIIIALAVQVGYLSRETQNNYCETAECLSAASHVNNNLNATIDPCTDFWTFACGSWLRKNPLPDRSGSKSVVDSMTEKVHWRLRHMIDLVPYDANTRDPESKVKLFYGTCMNLKTIDYSTLAGLKTIINQLGGWKFLDNWSHSGFERNTVLERLHIDYGVTPFFRITVESDDTAPTTNIIKILPSGLGLPSRNYYFKAADNKYESLYKDFLENFARQMGVLAPEAKRFAGNMFGYEKRIAEITPAPESYRNPAKFYKKLTVSDLSAITPTIPWLELLQRYYPTAVVTDLTQIAIFDEKYFKDLSGILSTTDDYTLYDYYMLQLSLKYAPHLPSDFRKLNNQFYQSLKGVQNLNEMEKDRWHFCLELTNEFLGLALGAMYTKQYFIAEYVFESEVVEQQIVDSFLNRINDIPWTDDSTTVETVREKMKNMLSLRGYPDFIFNPDAISSFYSDYHVQGDFLQNIFEGQQFLRRKQQAIIGKKVTSETSWIISPHEVLSIYKYSGNHLVIAAGLLQLPLFDPSATNAIKYGGLGTVLGSQIFKAFDDKGIMYEKMGILAPWLVGQSAKRYEEETTCLKEKIGNETLYGNIQVNADLVLGEAIADLAAVKFAFKAYQDAPTQQKSILPGVSNSNDELFFISYAQSMCQNIRMDNVISQNDFSTSSPSQKRVIRALQQLPEFSEAFSCKSGSPMNPRNKCYLW